MNINYRSTKSIINISEKLRLHNQYSIQNKKIISKRIENWPCFSFSSENPNDEAKRLLEIIKTLKKNNLIHSYREIAILFKSVLLESKYLIYELNKQNIPYRIYGIDKINTSKILNSFIELWCFCSNFNNNVNVNTNLFYYLRNLFLFV